jgi:hypothetical protein
LIEEDRGSGYQQALIQIILWHLPGDDGRFLFNTRAPGLVISEKASPPWIEDDLGNSLKRLDLENVEPWGGKRWTKIRCFGTRRWQRILSDI